MSIGTFDFTEVRRDDLKLALGAAIGLGTGPFLTSTDELTGRVLFAIASAALAGLTVVLFTALD